MTSLHAPGWITDAKKEDRLPRSPDQQAGQFGGGTAAVEAGASIKLTYQE